MPVDMKFNPKSIAPMETDVAIVGGGVSGIYSAWRLQQDGRDKSLRVKVFEYGSRVGGRLESIALEEDAGQKKVSARPAEVGGMRFIPSWQEHVKSLISHLEMDEQVIDFPMGDDHNLFFLRGNSFRSQSFVYGTTPYRLRGSEQGLSPDDLFVAILNTLLASVGKAITATKNEDGTVTYSGPTREEWDGIKRNPDFKFDKVRLCEQGFWNVLDKILSAEAYKLLTDAGGYYTLTANWNAAEAAAFIGLDFIGAQYKTLLRGYDSQVEAMAQRFTQAGGEIWGHSELVRFDRIEGSDKLKLTFRNHSLNSQEQTFEVITQKLILAMPRHGLERLELHGTHFDLDAPKNKETRDRVESVMTMPAFKLFMVYEEAWWSRLSLTSGRSVCDLPIRQTYYFGTDPQNGRGLLMTSYNDADTVSFWKGLKARGANVKPRYISQNTRAQENALPDTYEAPPAMVQRATSQLRDVHGIEVPQPIATCYKDWSAEPFGAGWFLWKAGEESWNVMPRMRRPWQDENVFVCGDCYSSLQGWVEGALNTAERMLEDHFDLPKPQWLEGVYLGY